MTDLIDTTEMYLRTILELEEENIVALRARIAERLRHSGPTVSQTIGRMERDGLVVVSGDRHLELTETGRKRAIGVMRKHQKITLPPFLRLAVAPKRICPLVSVSARRLGIWL